LLQKTFAVSDLEHQEGCTMMGEWMTLSTPHAPGYVFVAHLEVNLK
jgi:hypothetical protein